MNESSRYRRNEIITLLYLLFATSPSFLWLNGCSLSRHDEKTWIIAFTHLRFLEVGQSGLRPTWQLRLVPV